MARYTRDFFFSLPLIDDGTSKHIVLPAGDYSDVGSLRRDDLLAPAEDVQLEVEAGCVFGSQGFWHPACFRGGSQFGEQSTFHRWTFFEGKQDVGRFTCFKEPAEFASAQSFADGILFAEGSKFHSGTIFGDGGSFGGGCKFGAGCAFGDGNIFGGGCGFGSRSTFGAKNRFGGGCAFHAGCEFGLSCVFLGRSIFSGGCTFEGGRRPIRDKAPYIFVNGIGSAGEAYFFGFLDGLHIQARGFHGSENEVMNKIAKTGGSAYTRDLKLAVEFAKKFFSED